MFYIRDVCIFIRNPRRCNHSRRQRRLHWSHVYLVRYDYSRARSANLLVIIYSSLNTPPSVAPLISGLLLIRWAWQSIFWFLTIASGTVFFSVFFFLPETCRNIVGDGTLSPKWQNKVIIPWLNPPKPSSAVLDNTAAETEKAPPKKMITPLEVLAIFKNPGTLISILCYGIFYTMYSCLQASLSTIFVDQYGVSGLAAGLSYLPFGIATVIASTFGGECNYSHIYFRTFFG